jgi:hypothetical protein
MNIFKSIAVASALMLASQLTHAIPVRWTLEGVAFNDGTVATGAFTFDASTVSYSDLLISTLGATELTYTVEDIAPVFFGVSQNGVEMIDGFVPNDNLGRTILNLTFAGALTDAGGRLDLLDSFPSFQGRCTRANCTFASVDRQVIRGSVRGTPINEPAMPALLMIGFGLIAFMRHVTARSSA